MEARQCIGWQGYHRTILYLDVAADHQVSRMITAGEDPTYIARRLVVMASEDVGLADNHALPLVRPMLCN